MLRVVWRWEEPGFLGCEPQNARVGSGWQVSLSQAERRPIAGARGWGAACLVR